MPPDDLSQTQVNVELPPGSTFKDTLEAAEQARNRLRAAGVEVSVVAY